MYKVVRFYFNRPGSRRTIETGLSLEEAQSHCSDPETSSSTCKGQAAKRITARNGEWFDGYEEYRQLGFAHVSHITKARSLPSSLL